MSLEMVTKGTIPNITDFLPDLTLQALYQGRDAVLAIIVIARGSKTLRGCPPLTVWACLDMEGYISGVAYLRRSFGLC
jgi:hypothetical protein